MPPLAFPEPVDAGLLRSFLSNRTLAILSAAFLPPIEEEAACIPSPRHIPFIHRLRRRYIALAGAERGLYAAGQWQCQDYQVPTRSTEIAVFTNTPSVSRLRPQASPSPSILAEAPLLSTSAKTAADLRVERLRPPAVLRCSLDTASRHGVGRVSAPAVIKLFDGYTLRLARHLRLRLRWRPASVSLSTRNLAFCYSGSSMPCRCSPSSGRRRPAISTPSPHRGSCHCHSVRRLHFIIRDERIGNRLWHFLFHLSPRAECRRLRLSTHLERGLYVMAFFSAASIRQSLASPVIAPPSGFWPRFRCSHFES